MTLVKRYPAQVQSGRPVPALMILAAIFTTAMLLRLPIASAPVEQGASAIDSRSLSVWAALASPSTNRPATAESLARESGMVAAAPTAILLAPVDATATAVTNESTRPEVRQHRPNVVTAEPAVATEPALISTANAHISELATAVTQISFVESPSRPFGPLGTAFIKTGNALTLAFKKTGQGLLAPF